MLGQTDVVEDKVKESSGHGDGRKEADQHTKRQGDRKAFYNAGPKGAAKPVQDAAGYES